MRAVFLFVYISFWSLFASAQGQLLPKSVAVISGSPLTVVESHLEVYGMKTEDNKGGWGDVMANISSAIEMKERFPSINVRLIVTLNDSETNPYVNRTRDIALKSMAGVNGEVVLNPDLRNVQYYKGVEVYFIDLPMSLHGPSQERKKSELALIEKATAHIPPSEVGVQFSANNSPVDPKIAKVQEMYLTFLEYTHDKRDILTFLRNESPLWIRMNSGPLNFGVYGFNHNDKKRNREIISQYAIRNKIRIDLAHGEIAYSNAGDASMIEDYVSAIKIVAAKDKNTPHYVFYKGKGSIETHENLMLIPLGFHSKDLAHALIAESTYSPLITGDGSLSSALASASIKGKRPKSFIYELVPWKESFMFSLFYQIFGRSETAETLLIPVNDREGRVQKILAALALDEVHTKIHKHFSSKPLQFDLVDNVVNIFQMRKVFNVLKKSSGLADDAYLAWLSSMAEKMKASDHILELFQFEIWRYDIKKDNSKILHTWYSLATAWALDMDVSERYVEKAVADWNFVLGQKESDKQILIREVMLGLIEFMNLMPKARAHLARISQMNPEFEKNYRSFSKGYKDFFSKPLSRLCKTHF